MEVTVLLANALIALIAIAWLLGPRKIPSKHFKCMTVPGNPILGNALQIHKEGAGFIQKCRKKVHDTHHHTFDLYVISVTRNLADVAQTPVFPHPVRQCFLSQSPGAENGLRLRARPHRALLPSSRV
jgi:hypothetical protein